MELEKAKEIIEVLADGFNPITGEEFPPDSPYNNPEIIRALFAIILELNSPAKKQKAQDRNIDNNRPENAGLPWTEELKEEVAELYSQGQAIKEIAKHFKRSTGSIRSELTRQGLIDVGQGNRVKENK